LILAFSFHEKKRLGFTATVPAASPAGKKMGGRRLPNAQKTNLITKHFL